MATDQLDIRLCINAAQKVKRTRATQVSVKVAIQYPRTVIGYDYLQNTQCRSDL